MEKMQLHSWSYWFSQVYSSPYRDWLVVYACSEQPSAQIWLERSLKTLGGIDVGNGVVVESFIYGSLGKVTVVLVDPTNADKRALGLDIAQRIYQEQHPSKEEVAYAL
jgi:hypothetical protein